VVPARHLELADGVGDEPTLGLARGRREIDAEDGVDGVVGIGEKEVGENGCSGGIASAPSSSLAGVTETPVVTSLGSASLARSRRTSTSARVT